MADENELIELNITPVKEMFYNDETTYGIYAVEPDDSRFVEVNKKYGTITIKGNCAKLDVKERTSYHVKLIPKRDEKYGMNYEIHTIYEDIQSKNGQITFLEAILTKKQTQHLIEAYPNQNIIELIKNDQVDINKVKGIGEASIKTIKQNILDNIENQKAFEHLKQYGLTNEMIQKLVKHFGSADLLIQEIEKNPYIIIQTNGIGFLKADPIALQMGIEKDSPFRIQSAIRFIINQEAESGHVYILIDQLLEKVYELIHVSYETISNQLNNTKGIIIENERIALKKYYNDEKYIAEKLLNLLNNSTKLNIDIEKFIIDKENELKVHLTEQQKQILRNVVDYNVNVLAGYAGSGKSFSMQFVIKLLDELQIDYQLVSPTAKAAKVLASYTGENVTTIHRAIGIKGSFQKQEFDNVIDSKFLLIDESSMVNGSLCARLLRDCVNPNLRILFVGDPAQLPAIGISQVLVDMINSNIIPTVKLDKIFRQSEGGIIDKATKIRNGEVFLKHDFWGIKQFGDDLTIACVPRSPEDKMVGGYIYYYHKLLSYYKPNEINVITPTKKSDIGTIAINQEIQNIVNPASENKEEYLCKYTGINFRVGDLVMNTVNNYKDFIDVDKNDVPVINGDSGKILSIDKGNKEMIIDFEGTCVIFPFKFTKQLIQAWSISVHKSQGSSNRAIIFICDKSNTFILSRNLLYTAVTRPEKQLIILTQAETFNRAIKKKTDMQRRTFLKEMLIELNKEDNI